MTTTLSGTFVTQPAMGCRTGCRTSLVLLLLILVAVQVVLWTGVWEGVYISFVLPEATGSGGEYATPPMFEVRDGHIVSLEPPPEAHAPAGI